MAGEGLSNTGLTIKTMTTIQAELSLALQSAFGPQINLQTGSVFSTVRDIFAERESLVWSILQQVYNGFYPDTATGSSLDNVCALTNTTRLAATASRSLSQIFFGTVGTVVPQGTQISVAGNSTAVFSVDTAVTLIAGQNEIQTLTFSAIPTGGTFVLVFGALSTSALAWNATASQIQNAVQLLAGYGGVTVTGSFSAGFVFTYTGATASGNGLRSYALFSVASNSLVISATPVTTTVVETQLGVPQALTTMTCMATGPTVAPSGTLTNIVNPVSGLNTSVNSVDVLPGTNIETDSALRLRRKSQLQNAGSGTVEAIRTKLLTVSNVLQAIVFENQTISVDSNNTPAKGIQCFVQGGADQDIANMLWQVKASGIATGGTTTKSVTDSQGIVRSVSFSRPIATPIYVTVNITKNSLWPADANGQPPNSAGTALVVQAILNYGIALGIGSAVLPSAKILPAIADLVPGIQSISVLADITASPSSSAPIAISVNALATFASANIVVNVS